MDTPLTPIEIRSLYKVSRDIRIMRECDHADYIRWLESYLAKSNFNTIEGIEQFVEFKDTCHLCEKQTYSLKHQICKNPECFCYALKDPMRG